MFTVGKTGTPFGFRLSRHGHPLPFFGDIG